jgi:single-strand DNA-binding protein
VINATVTGNAGGQPELIMTQSGKQMARFSVASTMRRKDREPTTTWVRVVCFDETAADAAERIEKGDRVLVTGRLEMEQYTRKDGQQGESLQMVADDIAINVRVPKRDAVGAGAPF